MAIKGAKTIAEYINLKIAVWLEKEFEPGCLTVEFMDGGAAKITDKDGGTAYAVYKNGEVALVDEIEDIVT